MKLGKKKCKKIHVLGIHLKYTKYIKYTRYKYIRYIKKYNSFEKYMKNNTIINAHAQNGGRKHVFQ